MKRISLRNLIKVAFIMVGLFFYLYLYWANISPVMDAGYLNLKEIYIINSLLFTIIVFAVFTIVKNEQIVYKGNNFGPRVALYTVILKSAKILFSLALAYGMLYYSISF
ncbi:MAG: hypothetical protein KC733_06115 [Candidatus Omnitrophica bacterium]|nr:hypothetical protein [Candidatus Omnitrophota bacterium]